MRAKKSSSASNNTSRHTDKCRGSPPIPHRQAVIAKTMATAPNDPKPDQQQARNDQARRKLAQGWGSVTASMANPDGSTDGGIEILDSAAGLTAQRPAPKGAAPTNVTPLPLPTPQQQPVVPLPLPSPQIDPALSAPTPALNAPATSQVQQPQLLPTSQAAKKRPEPAEHEVARDRHNIAAAVSWTIFAIVVATTITFINGTSGNAFTDLGPGPFPAAFVSIVAAWLIALSAGMLGRTWPAWYVVPLLVLIIGPLVNNHLWQSGQASAARAYLSASGQNVMVDVDPVSLTSATVVAANGCFAVVQARSTKDTTVSVESSNAQTARQHANTALAPRFAARIESGGPASNSHIFLFQRGQAPPVVNAPSKPPLDCAIAGG